MTIVQASFQFSLQYAAVAANNGSGTFGTAVQVPAAKTLDITIQYIKDTAEGNSQHVALAAQIIDVKWALSGVNLNAQMIQILNGITPSSSNSGVNEVDTVSLANNLMPYFGMVAQAWGQNGDDHCICIPYAKTMEDWNYKFDFGKFLMPSFKGEGIVDSTLGYMLQHKWHATKLANPVFPPAWA